MPTPAPLTESQRLMIEALEEAQKKYERKVNMITAEVRRIKGEPTKR